MKPLSRLLPVLLLGLLLGGCDWGDRISALETHKQDVEAWATAVNTWAQQMVDYSETVANAVCRLEGFHQNDGGRNDWRICPPDQTPPAPPPPPCDLGMC